MVAWIIATLIIFILFMTYLGWMFLFTVLELVVNGAILYLIFLRTWVEVAKENKYQVYMGGAVAAMVIYLLTRNFLSFIFAWPITTYILLSFICAQLIQHIMKRYSKKK